PSYPQLPFNIMGTNPPGNCSITDVFQACISDPCHPTHTAHCQAYQQSYQCFCLPGYSGVLCTTDINECASNPCFHGGTCVDGVNSFHCLCPDGWTDNTCFTDINECA